MRTIDVVGLLIAVSADLSQGTRDTMSNETKAHIEASRNPATPGELVDQYGERCWFGEEDDSYVRGTHDAAEAQRLFFAYSVQTMDQDYADELAQTVEEWEDAYRLWVDPTFWDARDEFFPSDKYSTTEVEGWTKLMYLTFDHLYEVTLGDQVVTVPKSA